MSDIEISEEDKTKILEKVGRFAQEMSGELENSRIPVIYCKNCGSINIDQNSVSQIACYNCGQKELWNGLKFAITRGGSSNDVLHSFLPAQEGYWDNWHTHTVNAIYDFGRVLAQVVSNSDKKEVASTNLSSEDYERLKESWKLAKERIDTLLT